MCWGRRCVLIKDGRSGLARADVKIGDKVVLFPGAELLIGLIQDESEDMLCIVGECYLDRVFLGSLVQEKKYKSRVHCLQ
jgi:hypothetical protein